MASRKALQVFVSAAVLLPGFGLPAQVADRWAALALIESGNNDGAIGAAGEVSRYQIKPAVWQRYAPPQADWANPRAALSVAMKAMRERTARFERRFQRPPTDFEFYVLWNAPAQVARPSKVVARRADRFCNLMQKSPLESPGRDRPCVASASDPDLMPAQDPPVRPSPRDRTPSDPSGS